MVKQVVLVQCKLLKWRFGLNNDDRMNLCLAEDQSSTFENRKNQFNDGNNRNSSYQSHQATERSKKVGDTDCWVLDCGHQRYISRIQDKDLLIP